MPNSKRTHVTWNNHVNDAHSVCHTMLSQHTSRDPATSSRWFCWWHQRSYNGNSLCKSHIHLQQQRAYMVYGQYAQQHQPAESWHWVPFCCPSCTPVECWQTVGSNAKTRLLQYICVALEASHPNLLQFKGNDKKDPPYMP